MTLTDLAAWWGAIIATAVLLWDVLKWRKSRAIVTVEARPNIQIFDGTEFQRPKSIFVIAVNVGGQSTTITHLIFRHYSNWVQRMLRRPSSQGAVVQPLGGAQLPSELSPGQRWVGGVDQADLRQKCGTGGLLYCGVNHTLSKKPVLGRVKS